MKKFSILAVFLLLFAGTGCEEDLLPEPDDPRDAFTGTWICTDYPAKSTATAYTVEIVADPFNSSRVIIYNFFQLGMEEGPYAIVAGNTLTVPEQLIFNNTWQVSGFGRLKADEILWDEYNANQFAYKAVFRRMQ